MASKAHQMATSSKQVIQQVTPQGVQDNLVWMYYNSGFNYPQMAQSRSPLFLAETHSDSQTYEGEQESSEAESNGKSGSIESQLRA